MKFKLTIDMNNAAFEPDAAAEVLAALRQVAEKIVQHGLWQSTIVRDSNGNTIGAWTMMEDRK